MKTIWEEKFFNSKADGFCIYQLRREDANAEIRFMNMDYLRNRGLSPVFEKYDAVYFAPLTYSDATEQLESLYREFNVNRPEDFSGHSMSVSDIVLLKKNDVVSAYYVDSIGFADITDIYNKTNF